MGMACERIPLRYGVRSDHLLCSVPFICSCIGTLEIIRILILTFCGEISNFGAVRVCKILHNRSEDGNLTFCRQLPCLATEGQYKDRQIAAPAQGHKVTTRGYHIICYHLKEMTLNSALHLCGEIIIKKEHLSHSNMQTAQHLRQRNAE